MTNIFSFVAGVGLTVALLTLTGASKDCDCSPVPGTGRISALSLDGYSADSHLQPEKLETQPS